MFGIPALASARKAVGFLLLPILFALVGLLALMVTQVYGQEESAPAKPAGFSATAGDGYVTISWDDPSDSSITNYAYRQSTDGGTSWSPDWADIPGSDATTTTHNVTGVTPGVAYTFQIRALNGELPGTPSGNANATPTTWTVTLYAKRSSITTDIGYGPDNSEDGVFGSLTQDTFSLRGVGYTVQELSYNSNLTGNHELTLQTDNLLPLDTLSGLTLKLGDKTFNGADATTVTSGFGPDRYEWNNSGLGWMPLQEISVSMTIKAAPGSPSGLKAAPKSSQTVELSWADPVDESITKYQYRQSADGGVSWSPDWSDIASSVKDTISHMVSGLTIGTEHTFSVRAVNDAGNGSAASVTVTPGEDWDDDDDGLIEVSNLAQLNAIRWDLDGDGFSTDAGYATAFSTARTGMGCPESGCIGYELTTDLDFDTNADGTVDASDDYWNDGAGWEPIGDGSTPPEGLPEDAETFNAVFHGGGHTIANLFINRPTTEYVGLFGFAGSSSEIRNLGLTDVSVSGGHQTGGLTGKSDGRIINTYLTGAVAGTDNVGGMIGVATSGARITAVYFNGKVHGTGENVGCLLGQAFNAAVLVSYSAGEVSGESAVGGLIGHNNDGRITASYTSCSVTGDPTSVGGLVGNTGDSDLASVQYSYWDTTTSDQTDSAGKSTSELQSPTDYSGIYEQWDLDVDGNANAGDLWNFGTSRQYPVLKVDFNGDNDATWQEFGFQRAVAGFTATAGSGQVTISWDDFGDPAVSHFEARQSEDVGDTWTTWETISGSDSTTTNHTVTGLTSGVAYTFQIRPVNDYGAGLASESATATPVAPNASPRVVAPITDQTLTVGDSTTTLDLSSNFSDPDGNLLSYSASSSNPSVVTASTSGSQLTLTPVAAGTAAVTVNAVDPSGAGVSDQFSVTVSGSAPDEEEEPPTTPEPTAPPTVPAPPPPTAQEILTLFEENPEQAGEVVGQLADDDPEEAGRVISESAEEDEQAAGQIICSAVDGHSASMGRAVGHAAKANAGSTSNALGTISDDGDCVGQLGSVIPVEPWLPEQVPQRAGTKPDRVPGRT